MLSHSNQALCGRHGSKITHSVSQSDISQALQVCLCLVQLELLGLIATPNSPIGNASPPAHSPSTPIPPPPTCPPFTHAICDITVVVKKLLKIQQCQLASRTSYKTLSTIKDQHYLYCKSGMATIQHKGSTVSNQHFSDIDNRYSQACTQDF